MLKASLIAIKNILEDTFPEITSPYINKTPEAIKRPSFFIMLATNPTEELNKKFYQIRATWQIVYFGVNDIAGNVDALSQYNICDKLNDAFMQVQSLIGPDGEVFNIKSFESSIRDSEAYMILSIEWQNSRTEPTYEDMGDVKVNFKEE